MGSEKKREIEIIISGKSYGKMEFPEGLVLQGLLSQVLSKTNNTGQPPENWEMRDSAGTLIDLNKHLRECPASIVQLWITLKAGIGG